jgi:hypothetical protein
MIMFEQQRRLSEPLRWGRREKTIVAVVSSIVALALIGLGAYALTSGAPAHECGAQARSLCAEPKPSREFAAQLGEECRRLGYPFAGG